MTPTPASPKQDLLAQAAREYRAFHHSLRGLNEDHLTEVWLGSWAVRDIVAHMIGWHREMGPALERLEAIQRDNREVGYRVGV